MLRHLPALALAAALLPTARADIPDALGRAQALLDRDDAAAAVAALEEALPGAADDQVPRLLEALRRAYGQAIRQAEAQGKSREATLLRDNLAIIEPPGGARPEAVAAPEPPRAPMALREIPLQKPGPDLPPPTPDADQAEKTDEPPAARPEPAPSLAGADAAFRARRYDEAGRLYDALGRDGRLPEVRRDPWAYCRMVRVVERINESARTERDWAEIRSEIDEIRKLSPKNWYAEYLRNLVAELATKDRKPRDGKPVLRGASPEEAPRAAAAERTRSRRFVSASAATEEGPAPPATPAAAPEPAAPAVGRAGAPVGNWRVWETDSFRIFHADEDLARRVAQAAETSRAEQARRWLGDRPAARWTPKCDVYLYPTPALFRQMTGQPEDSPGFSTMGLNAGRVVARRINLRADHPNLVGAILPHEVTHVVLADAFADVQVPRWADEGMAVLSEPPREQELRAGDLEAPLAENRLFRLNDLMSMDYPDGRHWSLYYAQSVSLTRFLVERGTPGRFVEFVKGSQRSGVEAELRRVYGFRDLADLQARWLEHVRHRPAALAAAGDGTPAR